MGISTAVDPSAVARVVGIKTIFKNLRGGALVLLPQRVMLVGQGTSSSVYSSDKRQFSSALDVANVYGFGSPLHLAALQLFPVNGDGLGTIPMTAYPLQEAGGAAAAAGDASLTGTATESGVLYLKAGNIRSGAIAVAVDDTGAPLAQKIVDAVSAVLGYPMTSALNVAVADVTAKWKGESGNDIVLEWEGSIAGLTPALTQPVGGLLNPDVDDALANVGNVWETLVVNCLNISDSTTLDKYNTFAEGRWGAVVKKPMLVFTGNPESDVSTAVLIPESRAAQRTLSFPPNPGSNDLPLMVAARDVVRIAVLANADPAFDYGGQKLTGLVPGADSVQWTQPERDQAVKAGSSTVEVVDNVVQISDTVTSYHPTGDPTPAYRFVVDVIKLMNIIFNTDLIFADPKWNGAPLIPDDQPTTNANAVKPKTATAEIAAMIDSLGLAAIISAPETAKESILSEIDSQNPKRLNSVYTVQLSGNSNIISIDLNFGFFFGTSQLVA